MRRMTPAKLVVLMGKHRERLAVTELPVAAFHCLFANVNRSPGNKEKGIPPAPPMELDSFRMFSKKKGGRSLAAKDDNPGGRHNHDGAKADRGAWLSWVKGRQAHKEK